MIQDPKTAKAFKVVLPEKNRMNRPSRVKIQGQVIKAYTYLPNRLVEALGLDPNEDVLQGLYLESGFIIFATTKDGQALLRVFNPATNITCDLDDFIDPTPNAVKL